MKLLISMVPGVIWTATLGNIVEEVTYNTVDTFVWTGCGFAYFLMYFGFSFSSALLVILSVEKFIALYFPLKTKSNLYYANSQKGFFYSHFNLPRSQFSVFLYFQKSQVSRKDCL